MLPIILSFIFLSFFYLKFMISRRFLSTSLIFYRKHLIKKSSKLNLLFLGKTCNEEYPRLKPIATAFLVGLILFISVAIITIISAVSGKIFEKDVLFFVNLSLTIALICELIGTLIYCEISNYKSEKEFDKMSVEEIAIVKEEIKKEWAEFFGNK